MSKKQPTPKFTKVSEWIAAGNMKSGLYCLERVARETDKAIGFVAEKYNEFGNLKPATCWVPKTQVQRVQNDFYTRADAPATMFLLTAWLYSARTDEGFVL